MIKAFKYRLDPTRKQTATLQWTLDRCRELYNAALAERKEAWRMSKVRISPFEQMRSLTEIKADIRPEYQEVGSHVLQDVIKRVGKAFDAFFRRVKAGQTPGYPRFQGYDRYDSFTFPDAAGWKLEIGEKQKGKLALSKIGHIKIKLHRPIEGIIKTATIKREGEQWYAVFACEVEARVKLPYTDLPIGLDLGLLHFATDSYGQTIENPRYFRKSEERLAHLQKSLSRKKKRNTTKGCKGNRRRKAAKQVGKAHRKISNQRKDFLHKESRILVDTFEIIVFEDLAPSNMSKRPKTKQDEETGKYLPNGASKKAGLNKSIQDAGWGQFVQYTTYKAECAGVKVLLVNPHNTSQLCSGCHKKGPHKDLSVRTHTCVHCGLVLDRDHNAALNILNRGLEAA